MAEVSPEFSNNPRSRAFVLEKLRRELPGQNLYELATRFGVTVHKNGKLNKGWVGQTIEFAAGLSTDNHQNRDGDDFELKSTTLLPHGNTWRPQETIKVTVVNPDSILEETFETSALWNKLARLVLVGYQHSSPVHCEMICVSSFDFSRAELFEQLRDFWNEVRSIIVAGEIADYNSRGSSRGVLQLRPTGNRTTLSTCPITGTRYQAQAFYATKGLVTEILGLPTATSTENTAPSEIGKSLG